MATKEKREAAFIFESAWDGCLGLCSKEGEPIIKTTYSEIFPFHGNIAMVGNYKTSTNKYGFINKLGKILVPCKYYSANIENGIGSYIDTKNEEAFFINQKGEVFGAFKEIFILNHNYVGVETLDGKFKILDSSGNEIIETPYKFSPSSKLSEGLINVKEPGNGFYSKTGYINIKGELVIDFNYGTALPFESEIAIVGTYDNSRSRKYWLINKNGERIINKEFDGIFGYHGNLSIFKLGEKYGLLDLSGKIIVEAEYNSLSLICKDLYKATDEKRNVILINKEGKVLSGQYSAIESIRIASPNTMKIEWDYWPIKEYEITLEEKNTSYNILKSLELFGLAEVSEKKEGADNFKGVINTEGVVILSSDYSTVCAYADENGNTYLKTERKAGDKLVLGLFNAEGNPIIPEGKYDDIQMNKKYFNVKKDDKWGICDENGKEVLPPKFMNIGYINESMIPILLNVEKYQGPFRTEIRQNWTYYNIEKGTELKEQYKSVSPFLNGFAQVWKDKEGGFCIDKTGQKVGKYGFYQGLAKFCDNEVYGYLNAKGEIIIPAQYKDASDFGAFVNIAWVEGLYNNKVSYISSRKKK